MTKKSDNASDQLPASVKGHYTMRKGDRFVAYDEGNPDDRFLEDDLLEHYTSSLGEEPSEVDVDGSPAPHIVGKTTWFDVSKNKVYVYAGKDSLGRSIWREDEYGRRFVVDLDSDADMRDLLGEIVNDTADRERKYAEIAEEAITSLEESLHSENSLESLESKLEGSDTSEPDDGDLYEDSDTM